MKKNQQKQIPRVFTKRYKLLNGTEKELVKKVGDGSIITRFEKTPLPKEPTDIVCPHFLELKWATGCPYDCAWCYLKGTLRFLPRKTKPRIKNYNKIRDHVISFLNFKNGVTEVLNTGELSDSLMWEENGQPFFLFIKSLFDAQQFHRVLFLTKTTNVQNLLSVEPSKHTICSFTLNADIVARRWEKGSPSAVERIEAARRVFCHGYETRIRIDPIMPVLDWEKHYLQLIDQIFASLRPERITLGTPRGLQSTINNTTDRSWLRYLSQKSGWGKRLDFNISFKIFKTLIVYLQKEYSYTNLALCKEIKLNWEELGIDYKKIKCNCIL
jgi:spore photoproduct lyase